LRILARFDRREVTLLSRNNQPQNFQFPEIAAALRQALDRPAVVDGEVVCFDEQARTSFRALQQRFHLKGAKEVAERMRQQPAFLYLFDIPYFDGHDVSGLPLVERKELLRAAVRWSDRVLWTEYQEANGKELLRQACRAGLEGIVAKHRDSPYVPARSAWWEFVIGGFTDPQRSRIGLGALLVGYYDGQQLRYAGKVGTGYTRETLLDLRERLDRLEQAASPFATGDPPTGAHVHWVKPRLIAEIAFGEWTQNGLLRRPRFEGLRTDKKPRECRREQPQADAEPSQKRSRRKGG
jgi:bifunctional non-homologous end joining protein LigD